MAYKVVKYLFRKVAVRKDTLYRLIDQLDANEDGRLELSEVAAAFKELWAVAMGKRGKSKKAKLRNAD